MSEEHANLVPTVFIQVLETLAMMFGDEAEPKDAPQPLGNCMEVTIQFEGPVNGSLKMLAPELTAREVAANVLGVDADDPEAKEGGVDALKELINITLGQLLTELAGEEAIFDLTPPTHREGVSSAEWAMVQHEKGTATVVADDQPILLALNVKEGSFSRKEQAG